MFVCIVDSEERAGKGSDLSEADEEGVMDLSLRVNEDAAEKHD